jgi:hypothetical protein
MYGKKAIRLHACVKSLQRHFRMKIPGFKRGKMGSFMCHSERNHEPYHSGKGKRCDEPAF